jgi:hypothetical protein
MESREFGEKHIDQALQSTDLPESDLIRFDLLVSSFFINEIFD